jgi:polyisoprenoid-binding protein YceI
MKLLKILSIALVALMFNVVGQSSAQAADTYALDKPHTQIKFSVNRGGWTRVGGWFEKFSGSVNFDEADVSKSSVNATIQTESINSGFARRDKHLRSPDFFNSKEFPTMTFKSTKVEKTGAKTGKMTGDLTLLGVTKPVTLDVVFNRKAVHPRNKKTFVGFTAKGKINRADFGMKFILKAVSNEVQIEIQALTVK